MENVVRAACVAALLMAPAPALAEQLTYAVSGAFNAPATGSYSGTYVYDTTAGAVISVDVQVTSGLAEDGWTAFPAGSYIYGGFQNQATVSVATSVPALGERGGWLWIGPSLSAPTTVKMFSNSFCVLSDCYAVDGTSNVSRTATGTVTLVSPAAVPTISEWAMILLGVLLGGGAALTIHRRRTAA